MLNLSPRTPEELASHLRECSEQKRTIQVEGAGSKSRMGGPAMPSDVHLATTALHRILEYEPNDLTISVEAGLKWTDLQSHLARHHQMIPLDPPCYGRATVGGVLSANTCGPRRRVFGSARDAVIGMKFATLEGKLIQSGGMVVKNVAGLDMAKLLIGAFGTLGVITVVNFKLTPVPPRSRTFLLSFAHLEEAIARRNAILRGVLQPWSLDLLNPHAAARLDQEGYLLALQAGGSEKLVDRYSRELPEARSLEGEAEQSFWTRVREFTPDFLREHEDGAAVRISVALQDIGAVIHGLPVPVIARAGNGVLYACFPDCEAAVRWTHDSQWPAVLETIPPHACSGAEQWPKPGPDFEVMKKIKHLLDPAELLNRKRLYGRI